MNIDPQKFRRTLREAWAQISDFRRVPAPEEREEREIPFSVLLMMPILAWTLGAGFCLVLSLIRILFNPAAAILFFLPLSWFFLSWKDSGRSDRVVMQELLLFFHRENDAIYGNPLLLLLPPLLLRFFLLFLLGSFGGIGYLPVFLLFSAGTQALLLLENSRAADLAEKRRTFFLVTGALLLLSCLFGKMGVVFALAAWLLLNLCRIRRNPLPLAGREALLFRGLTEWLLLASGILAI